MEVNYMRSALRPNRGRFIAYLLPGILLYSFVLVIPIFIAVYYGFFDWSGGSKLTFIGLDNYKEILHDDTFFYSLRNNIIIIVACLIWQLGLAFVFALLLNNKGIWFKSIHRTFFYFPSVLSASILGFVWRSIYDYNYGLLNGILNAIGRPDLQEAWLASDYVLVAVIVPIIWQYVGYWMIIILAGLSSIDTEILEMAEIDGANGIQKALHITLPLIKNTMIVCMTLCIAGNLKVFDHIFTMTYGGPGTQSMVVSLWAYRVSFISYRMGYGNAMSIVILFISVILIGGSRFLLNRLTRDKEIQQ